ncbi:amidohydrolase [Candidatus Heimdallarchaeota archaeon]|nr:MAG: amidohydrolase [Candidatus Gerdarchaeota archaeon]RLI69371.1 MAG: amidohydrolase [Candidatus Heimdallarchaeota archaeon]RLI71802.1 MAG: amidohydrolase [Candidatus Gerdarchaeota archaeon]
MKAILCKKIIPVTHKPIDNGFILIDDDGKIKDIGTTSNFSPDVEIIDAREWIAFPGIIDPHCHASIFEEEVGLGLGDGNESTNPITPHVRVLDAINPDDRGLRRAIAGGITTLCVAPGSSNVVGGQMTTIKAYGKIVDEMIVQENAGMKCAFGENPKRLYGSQNVTPSTRMGNLGLFRQLMIETQNYLEKWAAYRKKLKDYKTDLKSYQQKMKEGKEENVQKPKEPTKPEINIKYEAMLPIFKRQVPLRAHAHQANDIITAVRLAKEFNVRICIDHCSEGHYITDFLVKEQVPAIVGPTMSFKSKIETRKKTWKTLGILYKAGVLVALTSDHPVTHCQYQFIYAILAHREGLSRQGAYEVLSINGAKILGLEQRIGSLEAGKDADILLLNGDPLDARTKVMRVYINGQKAFDLEDGEELF